MNPDLGRITLQAKSGDERFHSHGASLGFTLLDFWRWSVSDLLSNAARGRLAEFIVARALGIPTNDVRDEWAAHDLTTTDGITIEVKSAGYVQSWAHTTYSKIRFATPKTRAWDPNTNRMEADPKRHARVYVFALLAHKDKSTIDPLDVTQWEFYILPTHTLDARTPSPRSITLKALEALHVAPVDYFGLSDAVAASAR